MRRVLIIGGLVVLGALLLGAPWAAAQDAPKPGETQEEPKPARTYAVIYAPGPNWAPDTRVDRQPGIGEHAKYHKKLFQDGKLKHGGPFLDNTGGLSVLVAADDAEAKRLVDEDPAIKSGLMKVAAFHPWLPIDWANFGK